MSELLSPDPRALEILESVSDGFVAIGPDWRYSFLNTRAGELLGRSPADLIGKSYREEYPEALQTPFALAYERVMRAREPETLEDHYEPWDRWFENRVYPTPDGGIAIYFTEITERKRAERALGKSEAHFRAMVEQGPSPAFVVDLRETPRRITYMSPQIEDMLGYPASSWTEDPVFWMTVVHPDDLAWLAEMDERAIASEEPFDAEYRDISADGRIVWVRERAITVHDAGGTPLMRQGTIVDITALKRAVETVREQGALIDTIFRTAPVGLASLDTDLRFTRVNDALARMNGMSIEETLGRRVSDVVPELWPVLKPLYERALSGESVIGVDVTGTVPSAANEVRCWVVDYVPVRDEAGSIAAVTVVVDDVTDRRLAEANLRQVADRLEALHAMDRDILLASRVEEVGAAAARNAIRTLGCDGVAIGLISGTRVRLIAYEPSTDPGPRAGDELSIEAVTWGLADSGKGVRIGDLSERRGSDPTIDLAIASGVRGVLTAPLLVEEEVVGYLALWSTTRDAFAETPIAGIRGFADELSLAIAHYRLREDLAHRADQLARLAEDRRSLFQKLVSIQEEERARVAREVHDGLGQTLTALGLFAHNIENSQSTPARSQEAGRFRERIEAATKELLLLVSTLRPTELETGLGAALTALAVVAAELESPSIDVADRLDGERFPPAVETTVYRIVQEALTNALRHAQAANLSVVLMQHEGWLTAIVEDDGHGFDPGNVSKGHFGLLGMRERAELAGGTLTVDTASGRGTTVRVEIPI